MTFSSPDGCDRCPIGSRREFVSRLAAVIALLPGLTAFSAATVASMPIDIVPSSSHGPKRSYAIPPADGVQVDKEAEVILARLQKSVWAFALSCPHQNTALRWNAPDQRFQCPKHKSKYRPDGTFIEGRATRAMDRYSITLRGGEVEVDLDTLHKQDADPSGWNMAVVTLA